MRIVKGTRCGFWGPPFECVGWWTGPDIVGSLHQEMHQELDEGLLTFKIGMLFRHDLGKDQKFEVILILENFIPEMFEYQTWDKLSLS
jgi:hypothetical protein